MIRKSFLEILTAEERRMVRNWTWGVLAFYGSLTLVVVAVASLTHPRFEGEVAAKANAVPIAARSDNPSR
jgi:hypothetical protein